MHTGDDVITDADQLRIAGPAQRDGSLAILDRLFGVKPRKHARRFWYRSEIAGDRCKRLFRIEPAGDDQYRVVGLVVRAIERLQPRDVDVLDVGTSTDRRLSVVVP